MDFSHFDEKHFDLLITNSNNIRLEYKKVKDKETDLRNYIEYAAKNNGRGRYQFYSEATCHI